MRVLVSPASTHGATAEIGQRIARVLGHHGIDVEVAQPGDVTDLTSYDGLVLGSAIYRGRWKPEALDLIERHSKSIACKPSWLFSSGPVGSDAPTEPLRPDEAARLTSLTGAKEHQLFGGMLDVDRLSFGERWLARWVKVKSGDARPWLEIDCWATRVAAELIAGPNGIPPINPIDDRSSGKTNDTTSA